MVRNLERGKTHPQSPVPPGDGLPQNKESSRPRFCAWYVTNWATGKSSRPTSEHRASIAFMCGSLCAFRRYISPICSLQHGFGITKTFTVRLIDLAGLSVSRDQASSVSLTKWPNFSALKRASRTLQKGFRTIREKITAHTYRRTASRDAPFIA